MHNSTEWQVSFTFYLLYVYTSVKCQMDASLAYFGQLPVSHLDVRALPQAAPDYKVYYR